MRKLAVILLPAFVLVLMIASFNSEAKPLSYSVFYPILDTLPSKDISAMEDTLTTFTKVEVEAAFPGGEEAWRSFMGSNLNPNVPIKRKAPVGQYMVVVQFIVDKDGSVSSIKALTNHGYGMEEEVMRVIRKSPRWSPAGQEGRKVKAYRKQPITFAVSGK